MVFTGEKAQMAVLYRLKIDLEENIFYNFQ